MKALLLAALFSGISYASEDPPKQVRVCVQYIEMEHPVLTVLLEDGDTSGQALHAKAMELAKIGKAKILETGVVVGRSGLELKSSGLLQEMYPTEYESPYGSSGTGISFTKPSHPREHVMTAFETKYNGLALSIEPNIRGNSQIIELRFSSELIRRMRLDTFFEHKDWLGDATFRMPVYENWATNTSLILRSGKSDLVAIINHKDQPAPPAVARRILLFVRADILESPSPQ